MPSPSDLESPVNCIHCRYLRRRSEKLTCADCRAEYGEPVSDRVVMVVPLESLEGDTPTRVWLNPEGAAVTEGGKARPVHEGWMPHLGAKGRRPTLKWVRLAQDRWWATTGYEELAPTIELYVLADKVELHRSNEVHEWPLAAYRLHDCVDAMAFIESRAVELMDDLFGRLLKPQP